MYSALSVRHLYTGSQNVLSNSVRAATCKPLCLAWPPGTSVIPGHFPIFLPGALQPLPGIWLSELAAVQASLLPATESGLVTQGPCCFFFFFPQD